jgi:hypothetical protein
MRVGRKNREFVRRAKNMVASLGSLESAEAFPYVADELKITALMSAKFFSLEKTEFDWTTIGLVDCAQTFAFQASHVWSVNVEGILIDVIVVKHGFDRSLTFHVSKRLIKRRQRNDEGPSGNMCETGIAFLKFSIFGRQAVGVPDHRTKIELSKLSGNVLGSLIEFSPSVDRVRGDYGFHRNSRTGQHKIRGGMIKINGQAVALKNSVQVKLPEARIKSGLKFTDELSVPVNEPARPISQDVHDVHVGLCHHVREIMMPLISRNDGFKKLHKISLDCGGPILLAKIAEIGLTNISI